MKRCIWCQDEFPPHPRGREKIFCSDRCRNGYHKALRHWAQSARDAGLVSIATLQNLQSKRGTVKERKDDG